MPARSPCRYVACLSVGACSRSGEVDGASVPGTRNTSSAAATGPRDYFAIPPAAFTNELGNFPDYGPCSIHFTGESHCTGRETLLPAQFSCVRWQSTARSPLPTFRSWAHFRQSGKRDLEFFRYAYPVMVKLTKILQAGILPGDHFPTDYPGQPSTYDVIEVVGHGIYNSGLWLLTQEIMIEATREALRLGLPEADSAFLAALEAELPVAKNEFETLFWDPATSHYKIDPTGYSHSNGYFIDFAYGQHIATTLGLPPFMNDERLVTHMIKAFPQFMQLRDETGHYIGPPNIAPLVGPILPFATFYARPEDDLVWTGSAMTMAATYISEGKRLQNQTLVSMGLEIAQAIEYQMIERFERGYMFNYPEYWPNIDPSTYAYSGGNRFRVGMDVLNSLKPVRPIVFGP